MRDTLITQVEHKRLELLQHPVVFNELKSKWYGLGLFLYLIQLLAYLIFIIPLSILVLTVRQPTDPICSKYVATILRRFKNVEPITRWRVLSADY